MNLINLNDYTYFKKCSEVIDVLALLGIQTNRTLLDVNVENYCDEAKLEYIAWVPEGTTLDAMKSILAQKLLETIAQNLEEGELIDGLHIRDQGTEHLGFTFYLVMGTLRVQVDFNDEDFGIPPIPEPVQLVATVTMRIYSSEKIARESRK